MKFREKRKNPFIQHLVLGQRRLRPGLISQKAQSGRGIQPCTGGDKAAEGAQKMGPACQGAQRRRLRGGGQSSRRSPAPRRPSVAPRHPQDGVQLLHVVCKPFVTKPCSTLSLFSPLPLDPFSAHLWSWVGWWASLGSLTPPQVLSCSSSAPPHLLVLTA